jgi:hypothetical protein
MGISPAPAISLLIGNPVTASRPNYFPFEVLTAVVMKSSICWDITPCSPLKVNRRFGGSACNLLHAAFLPDLFFDPEDGSDMHLRNLG